MSGREDCKLDTAAKDRMRRAAGILAKDAEARRDTAFACLAELLRGGCPDLADAPAAELHDRLPDDPETARLTVESITEGERRFRDMRALLDRAYARAKAPEPEDP